MSRFRWWGVWVVFMGSVHLMAAPETIVPDVEINVPAPGKAVPGPERIVPVSVGEGLSCGESTLAVVSAEVAATGEALGEQRTLITLINFTDNPTTPYTPSDVASLVLDTANPTSTASWIDEVS